MLIAATARLLTCAVAALVLVVATPARADDVVLLYRATWGGLPAARIRVIGHTSGNAYRIEISIASEGLPNLVTHFRATAIVDGRLSAGQPPLPGRFDANYDLRKRKDGKLRMIFVARGAAIVAERGAEDTSRKKELAEEFRRNVVDPLSALLAIQAAVRSDETAFTVPVYDGARRFDTIGRVLPRDPREPGIHLAMTLKAIAGFKGETSDNGDPDDAPRPVSLTLSDDARRLPLAMSVPIWFLPLDVSLVRICDAGAPCAW
jgi:Protein of unknown function (DUF3108)